MKLNKERFMYTFNGTASMTSNMRHNLGNDRLDLHKSLTKYMKLKYVQFSIVRFFFMHPFVQKRHPSSRSISRKMDLVT